MFLCSRKAGQPQNLTDVTDVVALPLKAHGEGVSSFGCASSVDACLVLKLAKCLRRTIARPRFVASSGAAHSKSRGSAVISAVDRPELHETSPLRTPGGDTMLEANAIGEIAHRSKGFEIRLALAGGRITPTPQCPVYAGR